VRSKLDIAMKNEVLAKCVCHNLCCLIQSIHEFGIDPGFWAEPMKIAPRQPQPERPTWVSGKRPSKAGNEFMGRNDGCPEIGAN
jgi:hypothetical protein